METIEFTRKNFEKVLGLVRRDVCFDCQWDDNNGEDTYEKVNSCREGKCRAYPFRLGPDALEPKREMRERPLGDKSVDIAILRLRINALGVENKRLEKEKRVLQEMALQLLPHDHEDERRELAKDIVKNMAHGLAESRDIPCLYSAQALIKAAETLADKTLSTLDAEKREGEQSKDFTNPETLMDFAAQAASEEAATSATLTKGDE